MAISVGQWQLRAGAVSDLNKLVALENHCFSNDRLSRRSFRHYLTAKMQNWSSLTAMASYWATGCCC